MQPVDIERYQRIRAPLPSVWDEVGSLDRILATMPAVLVYDAAPGASRAVLQARLAWGPVRRVLEAEATAEVLSYPERIRFRIVVARVQMRFEGDLQLRPVGGAGTKLLYRTVLECQHRVAGHMPGMWCDVVESHMDDFLRCVKDRAEHRHLARERLAR